MMWVVFAITSTVNGGVSEDTLGWQVANLANIL